MWWTKPHCCKTTTASLSMRAVCVHTRKHHKGKSSSPCSAYQCTLSTPCNQTPRLIYSRRYAMTTFLYKQTKWYYRQWYDRQRRKTPVASHARIADEQLKWDKRDWMGEWEERVGGAGGKGQSDKCQLLCLPSLLQWWWFCHVGCQWGGQVPHCHGPGSQGAPGHQPGHVLCMRDHLDPHHPRTTLPPHIHNSISCGVCMFVCKQLILALESFAPPVCTWRGFIN